MPPKTPVDVIYADGIERVASVIGYKEAYEALMREFENRSDSTLRQLFSIEGAAMNDVAEIVTRHPGWSIRFLDQEERINIEIRNLENKKREEADQIVREVHEVFAKHNKVPHMFTQFIETRVTEQDVESLGDE